MLLKRFAEMGETVIFYESPHRLLKTLEKMVEIMGGDRPVAVAKELTKIHAFTFRGTLAEVVQYFENQPVKGEFVVLEHETILAKRTSKTKDNHENKFNHYWKMKSLSSHYYAHPFVQAGFRLPF